MSENKTVTSLSEEDLLAALNDPLKSESLVNRPDIDNLIEGILAFLNAFKIEKGTEAVNTLLLFELYREWSRTKPLFFDFRKELSIYIDTCDQKCYINQDSKIVRKNTLSVYKEKRIPYKKIRLKQINNIFKENGVEKGEAFISHLKLFKLCENIKVSEEDFITILKEVYTVKQGKDCWYVGINDEAKTKISRLK